MKLDTFFKKFDQFADAPDAVAKMRELVLQLAVQGKLVPQDLNDEPASVLLERVRGARRRLADKGSLKTKVHIPEVDADDQLYAIPKTWLWVPLNELTELVYGKLLPTSDLLSAGFPVFGANGIIGCFSKYLYEDEMLLISCRGAYSGTPNISPPKCYVTNNSIVCEFFEPKACDIRFYHAVISVSPRERIVTGSAQPQVTVANAIKLPVPLPPLAEQKRIVAKVDELMALCDRLEAQQLARETRHAALARASLARFADAPTPANLPFLFHPSYAIPPADLRKSILTLAVQGKLVPQDPNDEPAETLASELERMKTQLLAGRRIRNQKVSGRLSDVDVPFGIPASWKWVRLGHAVTLLGGYAYESGAYVPTSSNQIIRLGNVKSDALLLDQKPAFIPDMLAEQTAEYAILEGDILVTMTGTKAKRDYAFTLAVKRADLGGRHLFLNQRVGAIRPFQRELVPLINVFLKSDQLLDLVFATATGTANQANIGTSSILDLPFPLPPLAEQRRIVAKVSQLMALVDALETQLAASRATAANLLSALVAELTNQ